VEQTHQLAHKQYGSHKFKLAIHQCLNKQLRYNVIQFKQWPVALCSNDAKSCYDHNTLLTAALCLCHFGSSQSMVDRMITTLHEMEHHIWTTFGNSIISASQATWQTPIAGIGQGNGASLHIWAAVSSPLLDIMRVDGFYAHMIASISHVENKLVGFGFHQ